MGSVNINGRITRRPGVRGTADVSALGGRSPEGKAVALVAEFPFLEQATPARVSSSSSMLAIEPGNELLKELANLLFSPSNDPVVKGSPAAVYLVGAGVTTQATRTLLDAGGGNALVVNALRWGYGGNRVKVTVAANGEDSSRWDYTIERDTKIERFKKLGLGNVLTLTYDETEATTMVMEYHPTTGLRIGYTKTLVPLGTYSPSKMAFDGTVRVVPSVAAQAGESYTAVVSGINRATGSPDTETLTWVIGDGTTGKTTSKAWSSVSSIVFTVLTPVVDTPASGSLTALAKASLADGDLFVLDDGTNPAVTFYFNVTGGYAPPGGYDATHIEINISGDTTDVHVAGRMRTAINGVGAGLAITAAAGATALVELENDADGPDGNVAITETLAVGTLTPVGMSGGLLASAPTFSLSGYAFNLTIAQYATAKAAADRINHFATQGFEATVVSAKASKIALDELDENSGGSIKGASLSLKADLWAIEDALGASSLVEVERATGATMPPVAMAATYLAGGSSTTPDATGYEAALASIENVPVQLIWVDSQDASVHDKVLTHCADMDGRSERSAWLGAEPDETRAQLRTRVNALNSHYLKLVFQEPKLVDWRGNVSWVEPNRLALMLCGMQAGVNVASSLTWKRPRVTDIRQGSDITLATDEDIDELLGMGLCFLTQDEIGWKVEDDITTWVEDDNPARADGATVEGVLTHVREVREGVLDLVADEDTDVYSARTLTKAVLRDQVTQKRIVSFDESSLQARDEGEVIVLDWDFTPRITKKFIVINAHAVHVATTIAG